MAKIGEPKRKVVNKVWRGFFSWGNGTKSDSIKPKTSNTHQHVLDDEGTLNLERK